MLFVIFPLLLSIFYLCLNFGQFDYCESRCVPLRVYPSWDSLYFLDLVDYFFFHVWKFSAIISSNIFSGPFSLFWDPYNENVGVFNVV